MLVGSELGRLSIETYMHKREVDRLRGLLCEMEKTSYNGGGVDHKHMNKLLRSLRRALKLLYKANLAYELERIQIGIALGSIEVKMRARKNVQ